MESSRKIYKTYNLAHYKDGSVSRYMQDIALEEPLQIRVEDKPYSVIMRTPGDELAHAAGFCLAEGLVDSPKDIAWIGFCSDIDQNSINVNLVDERKKLVSEQIGRVGFLSQTSCGICGRDMIEDLTKNLKAVDDESAISYSQVFECVDKFSRYQEHFIRTGGTHAVMIFDHKLDILVKAEDIGRHNAMDKSIGTLFLKNRLPDAYLAVLSSRMSFEMIQKAARAGIAFLISLSRPTSMAVELGIKLNMTLICLDRKSGFIVPCGEKRVRAK